MSTIARSRTICSKMIEWFSPYPRWVMLLLVFGIAMLLWQARRMAVSDRLRSAWFFIPRTLTLSLLVLILMNPTQRREHRLPPEPAEVVFLMDASRSMALDMPDSRAAQVGYALDDLQPILTAADAPRVQMYRFGNELASIADLNEATPHADKSQLAAALEQLPSRFGRIPPKGIVVFSDGRVDDVERLKQLAEDFRALPIPVHVFPVGDDRIRGDIAIDDLVLPPRAPAGTKVPVRGAIRSSGYHGERAVVRLVSTRRTDLEPLATLPVTLDDNVPQTFEMIVEARPEYGELMLEVDPQEGEATIVNNRVPFEIAQANRKIRVLYMEGTTNHEYRWVRDALQEDPDIECLAMVADQQYVERQRLVRVDDPYRGYPATRGELLEFDCVICSDINLGAFTREQLDWTVELVAERGGGFAMVGGLTSFGAGGWDQTVWDQLIPVDMAGGTLGQGWVYHTFRVQVPPEAQSHPIWRLVEDPRENEIALNSIPPFYGTNYMQRLKPAATVLAVSAEEIPDAGIMPIFASQSYGRGRTFAFAPDTTESWGYSFEREWGAGDNRYFRRFWRNVVRWLAENSVNGSRRLRLESDRTLYRSGQSMRITAQAFDEQQQATQAYELEARIRLSGAKDVIHTEPLTRLASGDRAYELKLDPAVFQEALDLDPSGSVRQMLEVEVVATAQGEEVARAMITLQILPDLGEFMQPKPNRQVLEDLASATGGKVFESSDSLRQVLTGLPVTQPDAILSRQPFWDRGWLWSIVVLLLSVEWAARRRYAGEGGSASQPIR